MTRGILIIAHNSRQVDYAKTAIIAGGFARKNLGLPVSLVTDKATLNWMKESGTFQKASEIFDNIIETTRPQITNYRNLHDGLKADNVPFINATRSSAYELTPYDQTLLIDSDFLIMTDDLNRYWDTKHSVLVSDSMNDLVGNRIGVLDRWTSETGVQLFWATTVMFTKNDTAKTFFNLVEYVKENYNYYSDLFRFDSRQYRNDISFSVALHIMSGFEKPVNSLPPILTSGSKDILESIGCDGSLKILTNVGEEFALASIKNRDVHIMNKQSLIRHYDAFERTL
jgi:hypothetical protein